MRFIMNRLDRHPGVHSILDTGQARISSFLGTSVQIQHKMMIWNGVIVAAVMLCLAYPQQITARILHPKARSPEISEQDALERVLLEERNTEELVEEHEIQERAIFAAIAAGAPIASAIFGAASFIYGVINGQAKLAELKEINRKMDVLDQKLDVLSQQLGSLAVGQQWLEGAILYGKDVQRLTYFLDFLVRNIHIQDDGSLGPQSQVNRWAEGVLSIRADGVDQVLFNFHDMMVGTNHLFGQTPLFLVYESTLDLHSSSYWGQVRNFIDFAYNVQSAGYAAWITALNAMGRQSEASRVQTLGRDRMNAQKATLDPLTLEWPAGSYGLPQTNTGCPVAAGVTWSTGWRKHDTEDGGPRNDWSGSNHFAPKYDRNNMEQHFCIKTAGGEGSWPRGNYCIFKRGSCPSGFSSGSIRWDDEDDNNANAADGYLPDGFYEHVTRIDYCCRQDGSSGSAIVLPTNAPFFLFRFSSDCQQVSGASVTEEYFKWDDEDDDNANGVRGSHPYDTGGRNHRIFYCYYSRN